LDFGEIAIRTFDLFWERETTLWGAFGVQIVGYSAMTPWLSLPVLEAH